MKHRKSLIAMLLLVGLLACILSSQALAIRKVNDLPGRVIGENPQHKRESQLPVCSFNGVDFEQLPCYSPPDAMYL